MENILNGLNKFIEYFKDFKDNYIIVGGTATNILLSEHELKTRKTKDIDMILVSENIDKEFGLAFWKFIKDGNYRPYRGKNNKIYFYRFITNNPDFPKMIELFSKSEGFASGTFAPIRIDYNISSLSAILLNNEYYSYLLTGKQIINNLSILDAPRLIAFKARAYIDLTNKNNNGISIDENDIKKHKNDIIRLSLLLSNNLKLDVPNAIKKDISDFINLIINDKPDINQITGKSIKYEAIIKAIREIFKI